MKYWFRAIRLTATAAVTSSTMVVNRRVENRIFDGLAAFLVFSDMVVVAYSVWKFKPLREAVYKVSRIFWFVQ